MADFRVHLLTGKPGASDHAQHSLATRLRDHGSLSPILVHFSQCCPRGWLRLHCVPRKCTVQNVWICRGAGQAKGFVAGMPYQFHRLGSCKSQLLILQFLTDVHSLEVKHKNHAAREAWGSVRSASAKHYICSSHGGLVLVKVNTHATPGFSRSVYQRTLRNSRRCEAFCAVKRCATPCLAPSRQKYKARRPSTEPYM